ncbi:MAG TPA: MFS transporter [Stellaceae bacterium]|jgi:MFS transporter, AAHS family, 4-hydroxybenzoate transporter|nr:MFS transporter [Stellaceae bacterium]
MASIDVSDLLAKQKFSRWHAAILAFAFVVMFIDGLDFNAINVAAPAILRDWHIERSAMGLVFGAGNLGILAGTIILGWVGDRYGRRPGLVLGVLAYSLPALVTPLAESTTSLAVLRFLAGCGIGGVIPNTIAMLIDIAPAALRASFVVIPLLGYGFGAGAIGGVAAALIPSYGWQSVFLTAGLAGTVYAGVLALWLPESIRFQTLADPESPRLRARLARLMPHERIPADAHLVLARQTSAPFSLPMLFRGPLGLATTMLWIAFFAESLTFITFLGWQTVLYESAGLSPVEASLTFSYGAMASTLVQFVMAFLLDRFSMKAAVVVGLITFAGLVIFGMPGLPAAAIMTVAIVAFSANAATHNSLNGLVGAYYPTNIRSNAIGFATGMGRIGGVIGPVIAGYLLSARLPLQEVAILIAAPYVIVIAACAVLGYRYKTNLVHDGIGDAPAVTESVALEKIAPGET